MTHERGSHYSDFQVHDTTIPWGVSQRAPAGIRVSTSGRAEANSEASQWLYGVVQATFGDLTKCGVLWASDAETGTVAGKLVPRETSGATPIGKRMWGGNLLLHMHNVFIEKPGLKPDKASSVSMTLRGDGAAPWFTVHLHSALATVRSKAPSHAGTTPVLSKLRDAAASK